jgi:hypothetical protein
VAAPVRFINAPAHGSAAWDKNGAVAHDGLDDFACEVLAGDSVLDVDTLVDPDREFGAGRDSEAVCWRIARLRGSAVRRRLRDSRLGLTICVIRGLIGCGRCGRARRSAEWRDDRIR